MLRMSVTMFRTLAFARFAPRVPIFVRGYDVIEADEELMERYRLEGEELQSFVASKLRDYFCVEEELPIELRAEVDLPSYLYRVEPPKRNPEHRRYAMLLSLNPFTMFDVNDEVRLAELTELKSEDMLYARLAGVRKPVRSKYESFRVELTGRLDIYVPKLRILFEGKRTLPETFEDPKTGRENPRARLKIASAALQANVYRVAVRAEKAYLVGRAKYAYEQGRKELITYEVPKLLSYRKLREWERKPRKFDEVLEELLRKRAFFVCLRELRSS